MGRRVDAERLRELVRLKRLGTSARRTCRLLRMGANTARAYHAFLAGAGVLDGRCDELPSLERIAAAVTAVWPPRAPNRPALDPWRPQLEALFAKGLSASAAFDRLRMEGQDTSRSFVGSYASVKRAFRQLRRSRGPARADVVLSVDTRPGEVAQVDFGYAGKLYDPARGVVRRAWVWVMILAHSRRMVVRLVFDQRIETWLSLHEQAFAELGGCVETVVPDNCRRAVLRAAFGIDGPSDLNRSYRELAQHYGFRIDPTPPRSPRKKGKVEAAVKYLRNYPECGDIRRGMRICAPGGRQAAEFCL